MIKNHFCKKLRLNLFYLKHRINVSRYVVLVKLGSSLMNIVCLLDQKFEYSSRKNIFVNCYCGSILSFLANYALKGY